jgi:ABC-type transport system involved in cytochrome c biogenesis permease subunit
MGMGIAIIVVAVLMLGLATFFSNRQQGDEVSKLIFGLVQLMGVLVLAFGCYMVYMAVNSPPHPTN